MSGPPLRPSFFEGQVLQGADLDRTVEYPRDALARHARTAHLWGIDDGLEPSAEDVTDGAGRRHKRITVAPGSVTDGTGRQVVVPAPVVLDEGAFRMLNGTTVTDATKDTWFPVFVTARDEPAPGPPLAPSACGGAALPTRHAEGHEIEFGRAGDELDLDDQVPPPPDGGPADVLTPWRVLVCFVRWDPATERFSDLATAANGVSRRHMGVRADVVAARGGRMEARARVVPEQGTPAVVVDEQDGGRMVFGLHRGDGTVEPALRVLGNGDVHAEGTLFGTLTTGSVQVESGIATDGMLLPLPSGISAQQVDDGQVVLHVSTSLRVPPSSAPGATGVWAFAPLALEVDADRRVRCRVRWFRVDATAAHEDRPAACHYTVVAAVPARAGTP